MSDIRPRKGPKGATHYQVRYPSKAAKSGYAYQSFATKREAREFQENLGGLKDKPIYVGIPVCDAVDRWLGICERIGRDGRETVEPETLKEYKRRARSMKEYHWPVHVHEIRPEHVVQFRNWLLENKTRDLSRRVLSSFHSVLIEMKHQGALENDPAAGITIKSGGRYEDDDEVKIPTDAEMRSILAAADRMGDKNEFMAKCWARYRPMIYLACFSGMRPSEYRGLAWPSLFASHVDVRQRADKTGIIGPVKSKAGRRTIYLPSLVTEMIFNWRKQCPKSAGDLVFPTESGKPIALTNFNTSAWVPLLREAGLTSFDRVNGKLVEHPRYSLYALRHYFASKQIEKGKDLKYLQTAMGHSRIEITLNVYGHLIRGNELVHQRNAEDIAALILGH